MSVVLATHNQGKIAELRGVLGPLGWDICSTAEFDLKEPVEDGETFEANALIKAQAAADATGLWSLADDSGLEVEALDGEPGVQTAYYGGWEKLLGAMETLKTEAERKARFVCVLALVRSGEEPLFFTGICDGHIAMQGLGEGGFGYDPVFIPSGETLTFAQMGKAEKHRFSHRGKAVNALLAWAQADTRE
ncbi:MAG: RdgB/HAM1 family non-canonical purine NTP pyrophosphatase [Alphaproteobacteria bacterium]|nr:MAG: RdgB/HAM1 family non-canonical purine NTP pyrophosphatase [Alphaproteobacteria bacterium]